MKAVDNSVLLRLRRLDAAQVLAALATHSKRDPTYVPVQNQLSERWHTNFGEQEFELLITGPKFWDTRGRVGGGGAIDLVMHLTGDTFKDAIQRLKLAGF